MKTIFLTVILFILSCLPLFTRRVFVNANNISVPEFVIPAPPPCRQCYGCEADTNDEGWCNCDADCEFFGDCCGLLRSQRPADCDGKNLSITHIKRWQFTCESIHVDDDSAVLGQGDYYWMVSTCSDKWLDEVGESGEEASNSCTSSTRDLPPVTDNITGIVYKNKYCALCNNVHAVIIWDSMLVCSDFFYLLLMNNNMSISSFNISIFQEECRTSLYLKPIASSPRACLPAINYCPSYNDSALYYDYEDYEALLNECENGPYNLQCSGNDIYLNIACADCNGAYSSYCYTPFYGFIPFTIVLSNFGGGHVMLEVGTETLDSTIKCPEGQAPVGIECRDTICPDSFEQIDGRCFYQPKLFNNISSNNSESFFLDCPTELVQLSEDEFTRVSNDSVVLNDGNIRVVYAYSKEDGLPLICPDNVTDYNYTVNRTTFLYPPGFVELTYVGCSLSVIGSALVLMTYCLFKQLRSLPSKILMNLAFANLLTNLLILAGGPVSQAFPIVQLCTTVAILLHLCFLSQFAWMSIMSFEIVRKLYQAKQLTKDTKQEEVSILATYLLVGWGVPILITMITVVVNFTKREFVLYGTLADGSLGLCWINHLESAVVVFLVPLVLCLCFNLLMFIIIIIHNIAASRAQAKLKQSHNNISYLGVTLTVFSVTGLTWIFGFLAILAGSSWAWYLFIIINSTQGFVIFVAFLVKKKILMLYHNRLTLIKKKVTNKTLSRVETQMEVIKNVGATSDSVA